MKIHYILRGIMRGVTTNGDFNLWFEWFHPKFLRGVVEGTLNSFFKDHEVVQSCLKLLIECVNNRSNRMKFDTQNINGLIAFKEAAKYVTKLLQVWDCLRATPT
jgi:hypothetical protein